MKISELIKRLETIKARAGDIEVLKVEDDGRSSWLAEPEVNVKWTNQWPARKYYWRISI